VIKFLINSYKTSDIIKYPLITSKTIQLLNENKYSFIVSSKTNKELIKKSIEQLFQVKVIKVTTSQLPKQKKCVGRSTGWKTRYKKAIITLIKGNKINLFKNN